jgi:hypothetical protein
LWRTSLWQIQETKANSSRAQQEREVIVEREKSENEHFGIAALDIGKLFWADGDWLKIVIQGLMKSFDRRTATNYLERCFAFALIEGIFWQNWLHIYAGQSDSCWASTFIFESIQKCQFFILGKAAFNLKVLNREKGALALNESQQLQSSGNSENSGKKSHDPRPPQHALFKFLGFGVVSISLLGALVGIWSVVFWDGLGNWRWVVSLVGWLLAVVSVLIPFHGNKILSAPAYRRSENIRVFAVIVAELDSAT